MISQSYKIVLVKNMYYSNKIIKMNEIVFIAAKHVDFLFTTVFYFIFFLISSHQSESMSRFYSIFHINNYNIRETIEFGVGRFSQARMNVSTPSKFMTYFEKPHKLNCCSTF